MLLQFSSPSLSFNNYWFYDGIGHMSLLICIKVQYNQTTFIRLEFTKFDQKVL